MPKYNNSRIYIKCEDVRNCILSKYLPCKYIYFRHSIITPTYLQVLFGRSYEHLPDHILFGIFFTASYLQHEKLLLEIFPMLPMNRLSEVYRSKFKLKEVEKEEIKKLLNWNMVSEKLLQCLYWVVVVAIILLVFVLLMALFSSSFILIYQSIKKWTSSCSWYHSWQLPCYSVYWFCFICGFCEFERRINAWLSSKRDCLHSAPSSK